ncbi:hypothetical protein BJF88_02575 [Cellulosimicrobium sp. CUA-896]|nr:hypothetical protein [Cellulosimicrobium sp. CUA-896]OLT50993.1 hypothetical protein BJF88_02575 [Cellulosimicrobium sp. CUA-896]
MTSNRVPDHHAPEPRVLASTRAAPAGWASCSTTGPTTPGPVARRRTSRTRVEAHVAATIDALVALASAGGDLDAVAIDIPVGLPAPGADVRTSSRGRRSARCGPRCS